MACAGVCPADAVSFGKKTPSPSGSNKNRRGLLKNASLLASGLFVGSLLGSFGKGKDGIGRFFPEEENVDNTGLFPPGAITGKEFLQKCLSCQLCAASCPAGIIRLREKGLGGVELDYNKGYCIYDCHICMQVCPAGALKRLSLGEKKRLQIGKLIYDPRNCIVLQESEDCGKCADVCPAGGILLRKMRTGLEIPKVVPEKCIGCGRCLHACPSSGALKIEAAAKQIFTKEIQKKEEL